MKHKYKLGDKVMAHPFDGPSFRGKIVAFQKSDPFHPVVVGKLNGKPIRVTFDLNHISPIPKKKKNTFKPNARLKKAFKSHAAFVKKQNDAHAALEEIEQNALAGVRNVVNKIWNETAKRGQFIHWVNAEKELPPLIKDHTCSNTYFIKITRGKKIIRTTGFYSTEGKKFYCEGGRYNRKNVEWLNEII